MSTAVITASYANDFDRCRLLCDSMDRHLAGSWTHYILVAGCDVALFGALRAKNRVIVDERDLLPSWIRSMGDPTTLGRRKMWLTPFSLPLRGWHVQQLRRLGVARHLSEPVMFAADSDVVFVRDFDPARLMNGDSLTLYRKDKAIDANARSNHLAWLAQSDQLLGVGPHALPAHDYINTLIAWRTDSCRALLDHIEARHGRHWVRAMVRTRAFSECIIYGRFVDEVLAGKGHVASPDGLCHVLWSDDGGQRSTDTLRHLIDGLQPHQVGVGVQSFIGYDLGDIRQIVLKAA